MKVSLIIVGVKFHFKVLFRFVQSLPSFLLDLTSKSLVPTQQHLEACPQCNISGSVQTSLIRIYIFDKISM